MKTRISILLLSAATTLIALSSSASATAVRDTSGRTLRPTGSYYILPVSRGLGGGLGLASRKDLCPLYVAQESHEVDDGVPIKFSPVDPSDNVVRLSTDMNIQFEAVTICVQSLVWKLGGVEGDTGRRYVATDGVKGNPGSATLSNWFKIEKYDTDYKLVFCPGVCSFCKPVCGDLGVFSEDGKRWLGLSDVPFKVMFKKANST